MSLGPASVQLLRGSGPIFSGGEGLTLLYRYVGDAPGVREGYLLLSAGAKLTEIESSSELLLVTCRDQAAPAEGGSLRWRQDRSVQALAQEMRRALFADEPPPLPFFEHLANALLVAALAAAARRAPKRSAARIPARRLDPVLRMVEERLREPLCVDQLARAAGMSRARFAAAFKATMGQSPMAYVRGRRLANVRRALEAGESDLAGLAVRCGFASHAHMTTTFRMAFGLSPSAYRTRFLEAPPNSADGETEGAPADPRPMGEAAGFVGERVGAG